MLSYICLSGRAKMLEITAAGGERITAIVEVMESRAYLLQTNPCGCSLVLNGKGIGHEAGVGPVKRSPFAQGHVVSS